jgi:hypothetical protein
MSSLRIVPVTLAEAKAFVAAWHRHHAPPAAARFTLGVADGDGVLHGVAITGRPTNRMSDDGLTAEVTRVAPAGVMPGSSEMATSC